LCRRAILLLQSRRFDLAEGELAAALSADPGNAEALGLMARCRLARGRLNEAKSLAFEAIAARPDDEQGYYVAALVLLEQGDLNRAERMTRDCIERATERGHGYRLLAGVYWRRQEWSPMVQAANAALLANPSDVEARNLRAVALRSLGRDEAALSELTCSLELDPENAHAHANLAWSLLLDGRRDEAERHFREALRVDPNCELAQTGAIEVLKAKVFVYRWALRSLQRLGRSATLRFALIIGCTLAVRMAWNWWNHPQMAVFARPAVIVYFAVLIAVVFMQPIGNSLLLLHPVGRVALSLQPRREAKLIGACLIGSLAAVATAAAGWEPGYQAALWPIAVAWPVLLANRVSDRFPALVLNCFAVVVFFEGAPFLLSLDPTIANALPERAKWILRANTWVHYSFVITLLLAGVLAHPGRRPPAARR